MLLRWLTGRLDAIAHKSDALGANLSQVLAAQNRIIKNQEKIMSALSDAQAALTNLTSAVDATMKFMTSQISDLRAAWNNDDEQQFENLAQGMNSAASGLMQGIANAKAAASSPGMGPVTNLGLPTDDHMSPAPAPAPAAPSPAPVASTAPGDTSTGNAPTTATPAPTDPASVDPNAPKPEDKPTV